MRLVCRKNLHSVRSKQIKTRLRWYGRAADDAERDNARAVLRALADHMEAR